MGFACMRQAYWAGCVPLREYWRKNRTMCKPLLQAKHLGTGLHQQTANLTTYPSPQGICTQGICTVCEAIWLIPEAAPLPAGGWTHITHCPASAMRFDSRSRALKAVPLYADIFNVALRAVDVSIRLIQIPMSMFLFVHNVPIDLDHSPPALSNSCRALHIGNLCAMSSCCCVLLWNEISKP